jgi:hypothetical protein
MLVAVVVPVVVAPAWPPSPPVAVAGAPEEHAEASAARSNVVVARKGREVPVRWIMARAVSTRCAAGVHAQAAGGAAAR